VPAITGTKMAVVAAGVAEGDRARGVPAEGVGDQPLPTEHVVDVVASRGFHESLGSPAPAEAFT
jgi:hypothetical protein